MTTKPNGVHHIAICTSDIKQQIAFFSDVLGMELVALYWMHGVKGAWHGFMKLNDHSSVAFVQSPDIAKIDPEIGKTHSGNPGAATAPGIRPSAAGASATRSTARRRSTCWFPTPRPTWP